MFGVLRYDLKCLLFAALGILSYVLMFAAVENFSYTNYLRK
jgi:hypothetical protein